MDAKLRRSQKERELERSVVKMGRENRELKRLLQDMYADSNKVKISGDYLVRMQDLGLITK